MRSLYRLQHIHERADGEDGRPAQLAIARGANSRATSRYVPAAQVVFQQRAVGLASPSGVIGSGHHVVKRGVMPFDMKN